MMCTPVTEPTTCHEMSSASAPFRNCVLPLFSPETVRELGWGEGKGGFESRNPDKKWLVESSHRDRETFSSSPGDYTRADFA
jgi:hypothetical protein